MWRLATRMLMADLKNSRTNLDATNGGHQSPRMRVRVMFVVVALLFVVIAWAAAQILLNDTRLRSESLLDIRVARLQEYTAARELSNQTIVLAGRAFVYSSVDVTNIEWRRFVESLRVVDYVPGFVGMLLIDRESGGTYQVRFGEPTADVPNLRLVDPSVEEAFRDAFNNARDQDDMYTSDAPPWAVDQPFVLSFLPLYSGGVIPSTPEARREAITGMIAVVNSLPRGLGATIGIYEGEAFVPGIQLSASGFSVSNDSYESFSRGKIGHRRQINLDFGHHPIDAELIAPAGFGSSRLAIVMPWIAALLVGVLGVGFLMFLTFIEGRRDRISREVDKATEQLREQEWQLRTTLEDAQKFRQAVEQSADQIVITDSEGTILYANEAVKNITGYTPQEVLGHKAGAKELWGGHMPQEFYKRMWHSIKEEQLPFHGEIRNHRKNGEMYDAETTISPIVDRSGTVRYFIATERDMTHEREIERLQNEFVSIASHQLRTPLGGIRWVAERLMKTEKLSEEGFRYLQDILSAARNLADLVDLLLNVSRIEQEGGPSARPEPLDLVAFVQGILSELSIVADKKGVTLNFGPPSGEVMMETDRAALRNIVQTFLSNAIEYTPPGGRVIIRVDVRDSVVRIAIQDTGIGIPPGEYSNLFKKFFRGEKARNVKPGGTGLGLYLAKKAAELLKGTVWFESEVGQGTTFFAELPRKTLAKVGGKPLA